MIRIAKTPIVILAIVTTGIAVAQTKSSEGQKFPDVVAVKLQPTGTNRFDFDVTVSSPYDTLERYADAFRVMSSDGVVFGERELLHDHANEQPFARDLYGVSIPSDVHVVIVQARDRKYGYGGQTVKVVLPGR